MTIDELIAEGKKLQVTNIKTRSNSTKYHTWTNNCVTYLEQIKFSKDRRNQFMFYAANSKFEPMLQTKRDMANEIVETKAIEQVSDSLYSPMMSH